MIKLELDWREILWWMQGGMAGSHLRWSVYEDMVNKVWPQCSEQERRNIHYIMERDLGTYWRNDDGEWREDIYDETPWMYFRQVLARFDPENQYAVTLSVESEEDIESSLNALRKEIIIDAPIRYVTKEGLGAYDIRQHPYITIRTYRWYYLGKNDSYFINWGNRCSPERITKVEKIEIPDTGIM